MMTRGATNVQRLAVSLALCLLGIAPAWAGEDDVAVDTLKVSIDEVVEAGAVKAVNGVTSSGQPTAEALEVFRDSGYVAVVDLRGAKEKRGLDEQAIVEDLGMSYVALPVQGLDGVSFDNAKKLDALLESADGPVLVHCGSGNRAGALLALRASLNGASDEEALDVGRAAGLTRLEGVVERRLAEER